MSKLQLLPLISIQLFLTFSNNLLFVVASNTTTTTTTTTTTESPHDDNEEESNTLKIIAILLTLIFITIIAIVVYFCFKKYMKQEQTRDETEFKDRRDRFENLQDQLLHSAAGSGQNLKNVNNNRNASVGEVEMLEEKEVTTPTVTTATKRSPRIFRKNSSKSFEETDTSSKQQSSVINVSPETSDERDAQQHEKRTKLDIDEEQKDDDQTPKSNNSNSFRHKKRASISQQISGTYLSSPGSSNSSSLSSKDGDGDDDDDEMNEDFLSKHGKNITSASVQPRRRNTVTRNQSPLIQQQQQQRRNHDDDGDNGEGMMLVINTTSTSSSPSSSKNMMMFHNNNPEPSGAFEHTEFSPGVNGDDDENAGQTELDEILKKIEQRKREEKTAENPFQFSDRELSS